MLRVFVLLAVIALREFLKNFTCCCTNQFVFLLGVDGSYSQDTCSPVRQYTGSSIFCMFPEDCCTRLTCSIPALGLEGGVPVMEITINPCTSPVTMNIIVYDQNSVLFNRSGISTSQSIPISYGSLFDTSVDLLFNATDSYVTVGVSLRRVVYLTLKV